MTPLNVIPPEMLTKRIPQPTPDRGLMTWGEVWAYASMVFSQCVLTKKVAGMTWYIDSELFALFTAGLEIRATKHLQRSDRHEGGEG